MTKKEVTAPVVKEEKTKVKRGRKPKTTSEVVENPQQITIPASAPVTDSDLNSKIAELRATVDKHKGRVDELIAQNKELLTQVAEKTKAYDNLRTTYNKLLEDFKVEKNRNKQVSKDLENAKARATEYKASWNAAKAARDQFASNAAEAKSALTQVETELADTKFDLDVYVTNWKKARMLAVIFGIAFVASLIVSLVVAFA